MESYKQELVNLEQKLPIYKKVGHKGHEQLMTTLKIMN